LISLVPTLCSLTIFSDGMINALFATRNEVFDDFMPNGGARSGFALLRRTERPILS
jgi:hypothetical protein